MNLDEIYFSLRENAIFYQDSLKILEVEDTDENLEKLSNIIAGKIFTLDVNQLMYGLLLTDEGTISDLIYVMMLEDKYWLLVENDNTNTITYLTDQLTMNDVSSKWEVLSLEGPKSWEVLRESFGYDILGLQFMNFIDFIEEEHQIFIARIGTSGEYGYKIFTPYACSEQIKQKLLKSADIKINILNNLPKQLIDITTSEMRMPKIGSYIQKNTSPIENELRWMIDFRKDEFKGKEAVTKQLDSFENRLIAFSMETHSDTKIIQELINTDILLDGITVGKVQYMTYSPKMKKNIGYGLINKKWGYSGIENFQLQHNGDLLKIKTISTPFYLTNSFFSTIE